MSIEFMYKDLQLEKIVVAKDSGGAEQESVDSTEVVRGAINQARASEINNARARDIEITHKCFLEVTAITKAIKKIDRINGFRVMTLPKNTFNLDHHLLLYLKEIK